MIMKTALALAALLLLGIGAISPAAHAAGTISACPTTITSAGKWTVTTNITAKAGVNCITVAADRVVIDLQGYTVTGSGFSSGVISDGARNNIIVANGTIIGFNQAINLCPANCSYVTVSNVTVMNTGYSGIDISGDYGVVTDSQANSNGTYGIYFYGKYNTVYNTPSNNNGRYGIAFLQSSSNNTVSNSPAYGNGVDGMIFAGSNNTVINSQAVGNGQHGMNFDVGNNTITDSQANNNKADGILIGGSENLLTGNVANSNGSVGISVVCPSNLYGNNANGNPGGNIVTSGTPGCAGEGTATITVSPNPPVEVSDPTNLSIAAAFAWNEFIALTWPALPQGENGPNGQPIFPRGQPDTSLKYGDPGKTGQVVWETFRHKTEVFPGQGNPNGYDPTKRPYGFDSKPDYVYASGSGVPTSGEIPPLYSNWNPPFPPFNNLDEATQITLDAMYAGAADPSPNASQNVNEKERILFEAKVNQVLYEYDAQPMTSSDGSTYNYFQTDNPIVINIKTNSLNYVTSGKNKPNPYFSLPVSDPQAGKVGSMEIKASFRRLTPAEASSQRYYTAVVRYYHKDASGTLTYVDSNEPEVNEVWGLTSLHIIQKTPNAPTFVYATFSQIDNIQDAAGNDVEEPNGTTKPQYMNLPPFQPALTITPPSTDRVKPPVCQGQAAFPPQPAPQKVVVTGDGMPPVNTSSHQLYFLNSGGGGNICIGTDTGPPYTLPINVNRRLFPIPPTIIAANDVAQKMIRAANPNTVWQYYRLINVQAQPLDVKTIVPGSEEETTFFLANEVVETNPALQRFVGHVPKIGEPVILENTFVIQQDGTSKGYAMGGCMGCHGFQGQNAMGDFSVLNAVGRVSAPDPAESDVTDPAVTAALRPKYFK
jgi:parallel beta-helix repeat protein